MRKLLCLAAIALLPAGPAAAQRSSGFELTSYVTLPLATPSVLGVPKLYREKDVLFSIPVGVEDEASLQAPIQIRVAGVLWSLPQGAPLNRLRETGSDAARLLARTQTYCAGRYRKKGGAVADRTSFNRASLQGRLESVLQLCLMDRDDDGRFDHGFLVGATKPADQVPVAMEPAAYSVQRLAPIPDSYMKIVYFDGGMLDGPNFDLQLYVRGKWVGQNGFEFPANRGRRGAGPSVLPRPLAIDLKKPLPQSFIVGDATFTVTALDKVGKTVTVTLDRDPSGFPIQTWFAPLPPTTYTIYI